MQKYQESHYTRLTSFFTHISQCRYLEKYLGLNALGMRFTNILGVKLHHLGNSRSKSWLLPDFERWLQNKTQLSKEPSINKISSCSLFFT